jgi:hypothetical protein
VVAVSQTITILKQFSHQADAILGDMHVSQQFRIFVREVERGAGRLDDMMAVDPTTCMRILWAVHVFWWDYLDRQWRSTTLITDGYDFTAEIWTKIRLQQWTPPELPAVFRPWASTVRTAWAAQRRALLGEGPYPWPNPLDDLPAARQGNPGGRGNPPGGVNPGGRPPPVDLGNPQAPGVAGGQGPPGNNQVILQDNQRVAGVNVNPMFRLAALREERAQANPQVPPPMLDNSNVEICLSYFKRGQCFSNCRRRMGHRVLTAGEKQRLLSFLGNHAGL